MSYTRGFIKKIAIREAKEGQYGKFANYGLQLETPTGEIWLNGLVNADKRTGLLTLKDADYHSLEEGMEVECMYETNEKGYHDIDKKTLKLIVSAVSKGAEQHKKIEEQITTVVADVDESLRAACLRAAIDYFQFAPKEQSISVESVKRFADNFFEYCKTGK